MMTNEQFNITDKIWKKKCTCIYNITDCYQKKKYIIILYRYYNWKLKLIIGA